MNIHMDAKQVEHVNKKGKKSCMNWEEHSNVLQIYVDAKRKKEGPIIKRDEIMIVIPPRTTITDYLKRLDQHKEHTRETITMKEWFEKTLKDTRCYSLLLNSFRKKKENLLLLERLEMLPCHAKKL